MISGGTLKFLLEAAGATVTPINRILLVVDDPDCARVLSIIIQTAHDKRDVITIAYYNTLARWKVYENTTSIDDDEAMQLVKRCHC